MEAWQSDVQRAADSYMALMGQLNEAGLRFLQASQWSPPSGTDQGDLRLPDVAPGGRVSAKVWLHNTTASVGGRPPAVVSRFGQPLPARPWQPPQCRARPNGSIVSSRAPVVSSLVTVAVGEDVVAGAYHGQLLVDGLADVVFPLRVTVLSATSPP